MEKFGKRRPNSMYRRAVAEIKKYHISALHPLLRMNHGRHLRYGQKTGFGIHSQPIVH